MNFEPWQWVAAAVAAAIVGFSKSGIGGIGMLAVAIFAEIMPAKEATGVVLPLLIVGDILALSHYHTHARWRHLVRLFPWTALGVVLGSLALGRIDDIAARLMTGAIVLLLVALQIARRRVEHVAQVPTDLNETGAMRAAAPRRLFTFSTGILAGFTTLVANAAGPLMAVYLIAMRLPKLEFVGTAAVFFFLINLFKMPFMVHLGLVNPASLTVNLMLAPAVVAGAWIGWWLLPKVRQGIFERLTLGLGALAGLDLCVRAVWMLLR